MSETTKELELKEKEEVALSQGESTRPGIRYTPVVDIYETEDALTLVADLPGVGLDDVEVVGEPLGGGRDRSLGLDVGDGGFVRADQRLIVLREAVEDRHDGSPSTVGDGLAVGQRDRVLLEAFRAEDLGPDRSRLQEWIGRES